MNEINQENAKSPAKKAAVIQKAVPTLRRALFFNSSQVRPHSRGTNSGPNMIQKYLPAVKKARLGRIPPAWDEKLA